MLDPRYWKGFLENRVKELGYAAGFTCVIDAASAAIIPILGFTTKRVAAGSYAAAIQSSIGAVQAGSSFAYLQSVGALGQGIFGVTGLAIITAVTATGVVVYIVYDNREEIQGFLSKNKEKLENQLKKIDDEFKKQKENISTEIDKLSKKTGKVTE